MHVFWKGQGCALIGACVLIRMNTVIQSMFSKRKSVHQENMSVQCIPP